MDLLSVTALDEAVPDNTTEEEILERMGDLNSRLQGENLSVWLA